MRLCITRNTMMKMIRSLRQKQMLLSTSQTAHSSLTSITSSSAQDMPATSLLSVFSLHHPLLPFSAPSPHFALQQQQPRTQHYLQFPLFTATSSTPQTPHSLS